jgi:hypothetical protein
MVLHARDDVGEIGKWIDASRLARCDERVQTGDARAGLDVSDEEVVRPSTPLRMSTRAVAK